MKRTLFILFVGLLSLVLAASAATAKNNGRGTANASEACGTKFSLVPTDSRFLGIPLPGGRLNAVATNAAGQVLAAGSYQQPQIKKGVFTGRKQGIVGIWDGEKMLIVPALGGYESEFNWVASDPAGGFWLVGTVWEKTQKGLTSKIVVGRFDHGFKREATIALPGSVRNIPHRILVVGQTVWVTGYFTKKFGEVPTPVKSFGADQGIDQPYAYLPPYTKGEAKTYPLLVQVQGSSWKQIRFPGEGWLDGLASRGADHLVVVGMGSNDAVVVYELQGTLWRSLEVGIYGEILKWAKGRNFRAFLDVIATSRSFIFSVVDGFFSTRLNETPSISAGILEVTEKGIRPLGSHGPEPGPQTKMLIPSLPGHGGVRFYGVNRIYPLGSEGRVIHVGRAILYPGYRESDYPFQFEGEGIATTQTEVWVVGALNRTGGSGSWQTAVLRACPPLKPAAELPTEAPPAAISP